MDRSIRILVANRPKLMRELILATLADEPGIEIVGEVSDESEIHERVRLTSPDLLVIALDEPAKRPDICDTLLRDQPGLRIIAVASQENCSVFLLGVVRHSFQPNRTLRAGHPECGAKYHASECGGACVMHGVCEGAGWVVLKFALRSEFCLLCCSASRASKIGSPTPMPTSELGRENLSRVAASAADIKTILVKDTGLMVELKRWVAKDATSQGQIISEADLTDDAIFDRLQSGCAIPVGGDETGTALRISDAASKPGFRRRERTGVAGQGTREVDCAERRGSIARARQQNAEDAECGLRPATS